MGHYYRDEKRADDPHALPDLATLYHPCCGDPDEPCIQGDYDDECGGPGWYHCAAFPGCLPDSDWIGPFETEDAALADAREGLDDDEGDA